MWVRTAVADLRAEPVVQAERISQLLLFDPCAVLEKEKDWMRVRGADGYAGWVKGSLLVLGEMSAPNFKVAVPVAMVYKLGSNQVLGRMPLDVRFFGVANDLGIELDWPTGERGLVAAEAVRPAVWRGTLAEVLWLARELVGIPYLWGGCSCFGFDCSGFAQRLFHFTFNLWLPRDSKDQYQVGDEAKPFEELEPGDLLFFPGHVGIWSERGEMIHASGQEGMVTVTRLVPPAGPYAKRLAREVLGGRRLSVLRRQASNSIPGSSCSERREA